MYMHVQCICNQTAVLYYSHLLVDIQPNLSLYSQCTHIIIQSYYSYTCTFIHIRMYVIHVRMYVCTIGMVRVLSTLAMCIYALQCLAILLLISSLS